MNSAGRLQRVKVLEALTDAQVANRATLIQTAQAYGGYGRILLGEGFCTMAISRVNLDKTITYGGEIQPANSPGS